MDLRKLQHALEVRELCYFLAVAEELHFAKAAERVGINQSPLSKAITLMEQRLGVKLFVRTRTSTKLAFAGEVLVEDARRILQQIDEANRKVRLCNTGRTMWLQVAFDEGMGHPRVGKLLAKFHAEDHKVRLFTSQLSRASQVAALEEDKIDVGICMSTSSTQPVYSIGGKIVAVPLWTDPMVVAMPPDHPLATQSEIRSLGESTEGPIYVTKSTDHPALRELCSRARQSKQEFSYVSSVEEVLMLVAFEGVLGVLGAAQVETIRREDVVFRPIGLKECQVTTWLIRREEQHVRSERHGAVVSRFAKFAQQIAQG